MQTIEPSALTSRSLFSRFTALMSRVIVIFRRLLNRKISAEDYQREYKH